MFPPALMKTVMDASLTPSAVFNEDLNKARKQLIGHCRDVSHLGLLLLKDLVEETKPARLCDEALLTIVAFADETQDWGAPETAAIAAVLLLGQLLTASRLTQEQFISETILQRHLRPLFSRSKPASLTASGRKAAYADSSAARGQSIPDDTAQTKPWKYTDLRAIPAVAWAVSHADVRCLGFAVS